MTLRTDRREKLAIRGVFHVIPVIRMVVLVSVYVRIASRHGVGNRLTSPQGIITYIMLDIITYK